MPQMITIQRSKPLRLQACLRILAAGLTTMGTACFYFADEPKLPERRVVLTAESPRFDARFAVVTNLERFKLKISLHSLEASETALLVEPLGTQAKLGEFERKLPTADDPEWSSLEVDVNSSACRQEFCSLEFLASVIAADSAFPITGKLLVTAAPPAPAGATSKSSIYLSLEARD